MVVGQFYYYAIIGFLSSSPHFIQAIMVRYHVWPNEDYSDTETAELRAAGKIPDHLQTIKEARQEWRDLMKRESVNRLILGKEDTKTEQTEDEDEDGPTFGSETKKRKRKRKKRPAKLEPAEGELEEQTEEGPTFNVGVKKRREELKELKTKEKVLKTIFHTSTSHHVSEIKKHLRLLEMNFLDSFFHKRRSKLLRKNLRHSNKLRRHLRSRGWVVTHRYT